MYQNNMSPKYYSNNSQANPTQFTQANPNDERFIAGGFALPFLLGGVTGAAIAPNFWGRRQPNYYPVPYYGPYYRPYY